MVVGMETERLIGAALCARSWHLAVAESCTGGLLGHLITQIPGSSDYFWGGTIVYTNALKRTLLQVDAGVLERWGAVSSQVALEMARGVCCVTGAEVGLGITGIAGPGGATPQKPVGLTYIGLATPGESWAWRHVWDGDRAANKEFSARAALAHLLYYLRG